MPNLRATVLLKTLVWRTHLIFSNIKEKSAPLQFPCPALHSFFFLQHTSAAEFPLLFGMREFGGGYEGRLFLFPESSRHCCSLAPYPISREENPSLQLLLIRVKWSQPTISYWTPRKLLLPLRVCASLHLSQPVLNLGLRGGAGEGTCGVGDMVALAAAAHPAHDLLLIGVGGNVLAKLRWGFTPVLFQRKLDWTLITTP